MNYMEELGTKSKKALPQMLQLDTRMKNIILEKIAKDLKAKSEYIVEENQKDLQAAKNGGMSKAMLDRLMLDNMRIQSICDSIYSLISQDDPVGFVETGYVRPNGLRIIKTRTPIGVVGIIFESRPNVVVDAACLCLKAGNVTILRGGKEAINSNKVLMNIMRKAVESTGITPDIMQLVEETSRETANDMMKLNKYLNVLIPRGGAGLIRAVVENSTVPVIETGSGNCHIYVDEDADLNMALKITLNAKISRPSVCNAAESLLVHESIANEFLPSINSEFIKAGVEIFGCERTGMIIPGIKQASEEDYFTEYNDLKISVKIVDDIDEAILHIGKHSTGHSEAIITNNLANSEKFTRLVDSAAVYVNSSTRFTDGGEFGLGAEIGISTQKLHARGPMGLKELTAVKYIIHGDGQIR